MDACDVNIQAGLIYGMPVRPDILIEQLRKYEQVLPYLHTLRLCHRFGRGQDANINRLPIEVRLLIEEFILNAIPAANDEPSKTFMHFENKCKPVNHLSHAEYQATLEDLNVGGYEDALCANCRQVPRAAVEKACDSDCKTVLEVLMNEQAVESSRMRLTCLDMQDRWKELIDQRPGGAFVKYDKLLREHFGLQAIFKRVTHVDAETPWPGEGYFDWSGEPRSTVCYLALPTPMPPATKYGQLRTDPTKCSARFDGLISSHVRFPDPNDRPKRIDQFHRLRRVLQIDSFVHRSTLNTVIDPVPTDGANDIFEPIWPQVMMLVHTTVYLQDP